MGIGFGWPFFSLMANRGVMPIFHFRYLYVYFPLLCGWSFVHLCLLLGYRFIFDSPFFVWVDLKFEQICQIIIVEKGRNASCLINIVINIKQNFGWLKPSIRETNYDKNINKDILWNSRPSGANGYCIRSVKVFLFENFSIFWSLNVRFNPYVEVL